MENNREILKAYITTHLLQFKKRYILFMFTRWTFLLSGTYAKKEN